MEGYPCKVPFLTNFSASGKIVRMQIQGWHESNDLRHTGWLAKTKDCVEHACRELRVHPEDDLMVQTPGPPQ